MNSYVAHSLSRALLSGAALMAFNFAHPAMAAEPEQSACRVTLQSSRTEFPNASQHSGQSGVVRVRVRVAADGHVHKATLQNSSGYSTLDTAALNSIEKFWRFDTAHCSTQDLESEHIVDVNFERAKAATVSGTVDARSVARSKALRANSHCSATDDGATTIFACVDSEPAGKTLASVASNGAK